MTNRTLVRLLKTLMLLGLALILLGLWLHNSASLAAMGIKGILLSAGCVAVGMVLSLPTKMYLTFVLMTHENDKSPPS